MDRISDTRKDPHWDWVGGGNPRAIEGQEKAGQQELIKSSQLPRKINQPFGVDAETHYAAKGIKVQGPSANDDLFFDVILPEGWKIKATDHSMWSELLDEKGKRVASIFYKAAFYDRNAHINFE